MEGQFSTGEHVVLEDSKLESILDAVDTRSEHQRMLHNHISDGFMALARERYTNPSSSERLGRLVYDNREDLRSNILVKVDDYESVGQHGMISRIDGCAAVETSDDSTGIGSGSTLRRRRVGREAVGDTTEKRETREGTLTDVRNRFMAIPSREVREAIKYFRMAVDQAIEVANATSKVNVLIQSMH